MNVAEALCRRLNSSLPVLERHFEFADLRDEIARQEVSRLRQVGIMAGIGSMDGVSLFEPQRMVAREEFEEILKRALAASGIAGENAAALLAKVRAGEGHPAEPLRKSDLEKCLRKLAGELAERSG